MVPVACVIEAPYVCTAVRIWICALAGAHVYLLRTQNSCRKKESFPGLRETDSMGAEDTAGGERRSDGEEQIAILPRPADRTIRGRYNKSFVAKLMQSSDDIKEYYAELANELFAHDKIRNCIS